MIVLLTYTQELRISETLSLTMGDVDTASNAATIRETKFYKSRVVPYNSYVAHKLDGYMRWRAKIGMPASSESPLFPNRFGAQLRYEIYELVVKYAEAASEKFPSIMRKRPSPHTIRHTTATHLVQAGVDVNTVRAWLGHSSIETTNIYVEISMDAKIKAIEQCAPVRGRKRSRRWRDDKKLMAFLDAI